MAVALYWLWVTLFWPRTGAASIFWCNPLQHMRTSQNVYSPNFGGVGRKEGKGWDAAERLLVLSQAAAARLSLWRVIHFSQLSRKLLIYLLNLLIFRCVFPPCYGWADVRSNHCFCSIDRCTSTKCPDVTFCSSCHRRHKIPPSSSPLIDDRDAQGDWNSDWMQLTGSARPRIRRLQVGVHLRGLLVCPIVCV